MASAQPWASAAPGAGATRGRRVPTVAGRGGPRSNRGVPLPERLPVGPRRGIAGDRSSESSPLVPVRLPAPGFASPCAGRRGQERDRWTPNPTHPPVRVDVTRRGCRRDHGRRSGGGRAYFVATVPAPPHFEHGCLPVPLQVQQRAPNTAPAPRQIGQFSVPRPVPLQRGQGTRSSLSLSIPREDTRSGGWFPVLRPGAQNSTERVEAREAGLVASGGSGKGKTTAFHPGAPRPDDKTAVTRQPRSAQRTE